MTRYSVTASIYCTCSAVVSILSKCPFCTSSVEMFCDSPYTIDTVSTSVTMPYFKASANFAMKGRRVETTASLRSPRLYSLYSTQLVMLMMLAI